jgi:plasmid stabilization system protein ParE
MKITYAPRALRDIDAILAHIRERNPLGAHRVSLAIEEAIRRCALDPRAVGNTDQPDVFRRAVGKYPYTIFYRALPGHAGVEVARVVHGARVKDLGRIPNED